MYNYVMLMGTVVKVKPEFVVNEKYVSLTLSCTRPFRNSEGEYESDELVIRCYDLLGEVVQEHLKEGTKVTVKGRLRPSNHDGLCLIIGERVMFMGEGEMHAIDAEGKEDC